jgi:hypothetical protein
VCAPTCRASASQHLSEKRVFPPSDKFIGAINTPSVFQNERSDIRKHWFVASVLRELGEKVVKADFGHGPKVAVRQCNIYNRSLGGGACQIALSERSPRPRFLDEMLYPDLIFWVVQDMHVTGLNYTKPLESRTQLFWGSALADREMVRFPRFLDKHKLAELAKCAVLTFNKNFNAQLGVFGLNL